MRLTTISILFMAGLTASCDHIEPQKSMSLSAGVTKTPNTNYSVTNPSSSDFQPAHNVRIDKPYELLEPRLLAQIPMQLKPHSRLLLTDIEDRPFFDYFAWQTFIGLVWPADPSYRGVADSNVKSAEDFLAINRGDEEGRSVPVVWESFKTIPTVLPDPSLTQPTKPPAWNTESYHRPFPLDLMSKGGHSEQLNEAFSSPLIDQNRQYVRYQLQLNEVMYEFIRQNEWYLKKNLPKSPTQASLPPLEVDAEGNIVSVVQPQTNTIVKQPVNGNSITLKSAWRIMIGDDDKEKSWRKKDDLSRYFVSRADIKNAVTGDFVRNQKVGLVGLHIVVKTPQFKQGIWASFEHVDNVKAPQGIRPSFNSGNGKFYPQGFSYQPQALGEHKAKPEHERRPVEVSRIYKIPDTPVATSEAFPYGLSTQGMNKRYQELLKGTVWENYQLVITQWPTDPSSFYAKSFLYPRGFSEGEAPPVDQPKAIQEAYKRATKDAENAYPRWSGLPIPQVGALNTVMETYFQNPKGDQALENTSCMGCHYGAADMDYSWALKLRTWPQNSGFEQGRINRLDNQLSRTPANTK